MNQEDSNKYIILDVDGVLSYGGLMGLSGEKLDLLATIIEATKAKIVLSSTWRHPRCREQRNRLRQELWRRGQIEIDYATPIIPGCENRGEEIKAFLSNNRKEIRDNPDARWVILDDDPNGEVARAGFAERFVSIDRVMGLRESDCRLAIAILNS